MVLKRIKNRPASIPWILFLIGAIFFGIGVLRPTPSETIDPNFGIGVLFFLGGIIVGLSQVLRKRKRK